MTNSLEELQSAHHNLTESIKTLADKKAAVEELLEDEFVKGFSDPGQGQALSSEKFTTVRAVRSTRSWDGEALKITYDIPTPPDWVTMSLRVSAADCKALERDHPEEFNRLKIMFSDKDSSPTFKTTPTTMKAGE